MRKEVVIFLVVIGIVLVGIGLWSSLSEELYASPGNEKRSTERIEMEKIAREDITRLLYETTKSDEFLSVDNKPRFVPNELIIKYKSENDAINVISRQSIRVIEGVDEKTYSVSAKKTFEQLLIDPGIELDLKSEISKVVTVRVSGLPKEQDMMEFARNFLEINTGVEYAEPNYLAYTQEEVEGCFFLDYDILNAIQELQDSGETVVLIEGDPVFWHQYVVIPGHILRLTYIINRSFGQDEVEFQDYLSGVTYEANIFFEGIGEIIIGGQTYNINYEAPADIPNVGSASIDFFQTSGDDFMTFFCDFETPNEGFPNDPLFEYHRAQKFLQGRNWDEISQNLP